MLGREAMRGETTNKSWLCIIANTTSMRDTTRRRRRKIYTNFLTRFQKIEPLDMNHKNYCPNGLVTFSITNGSEYLFTLLKNVRMTSNVYGILLRFFLVDDFHSIVSSVLSIISLPRSSFSNHRLVHFRSRCSIYGNAFSLLKVAFIGVNSIPMRALKMNEVRRCGRRIDSFARKIKTSNRFCS